MIIDIKDIFLYIICIVCLRYLINYFGSWLNFKDDKFCYYKC